MLDDFGDIDIKLEHFDPVLDEMGEIQSFIRSNSPVNLNETSNFQTSMISSSSGQTYCQRRDDYAITSTNKTTQKNWMEEVLDFSSNLSRQAQITLGRIMTDFKKNGIKFDSDFRDHFLYIANNRLMESFDSFLIGLPKEMRSSNCTVNKADTTKSMSKYVNSSSESVEVPAKRKRPNESNVVTGDSFMTRIIDTRSNKTGNFSKNMTRIGSQISVKKMVSRTVETSTSISKTNKGSPSVKQGPRVIQPVISDRNKSLEHARNQTNYHLFVAENRMTSPKNVARRMTLGGPMIAIPIRNGRKDNVKTSTPKAAVAANHEATDNSTAPRQVNLRRKTIGEKELPLNNIGRELRIMKKPNEQLSVTLPGEGRVTRSRGKNREEPHFRCEYCDYTSEVKTNYQRHTLVHTGERPFKCKHCKKGFTQKVNLLSHLRANHHEMQGDPEYWDLN